MNTTNDEQALLRRIAELPREMQPRNDPWSGIERRIDPASMSAKPATRRFPAWPTAIAASLFVVICAGMLMTRPWGASSAEPAPRELIAVEGMADSSPADFASRSTSESARETEYVAAFREFLAIPPAPMPEAVPTEDWIGETRSVLRQTEAELAVALSQSPDDPLLQQRLAALRAHQLAWLKQMAAAERNSRRI